MIDAIWMLSSRALFDYANAATTGLLTRMRRDEVTAITDQSIQKTINEHAPRRIARKVVYVVAALVFTVIVGVFVIGVYTILTSLFHS